MAKLKKTKSKSLKPKGKKLSEKLRDKDEARAAEADALDDEEDEEDAAPADGSDPPPSDDDDDAPSPGDDEHEEDDAPGDDDEAPPSRGEGDEDEEDDDEDDGAAAQMGYQRYVIAGFFAAWLVVAFVLGSTVELVWSRFAAKEWFVEALPRLAAIPHEGELWSRANLSLVAGTLVAAAILLRYYTRPDVRQWADEVADELSKVKWPTGKDVSNNTVVVVIASAIITLYMTLLDRFWDFVTTLIYTSGT